MDMTPENFCYWLQGFLELRKNTNSAHDAMTLEQVEIVQEHLRLVFTKVTGNPSFDELTKSLSKELKESEHKKPQNRTPVSCAHSTRYC